MTARDIIFANVRRSLGVTGAEATRRAEVADRLRIHPAGVIPARGQLRGAALTELFRTMVEAASGTIEEVARGTEVPAAVAAFLRAHNLPMRVRRGADPRLDALGWEKERALESDIGPSDGNQLVGVS